MIAARFGACLLSAALIVGACGGDDDDTSNVTVPAESSTTTSTTAATTSTTEDPKVAVEQAFFDQWEAFVTILENPDPANPLIEKHFTGEALEGILDTISADIQQGYVTRKPENPSHFQPGVLEIQILSPTTALVKECTVDGLIILDRETGEVVNDNVVTGWFDAEFTLVDGSWKVSNTELTRKKQGVNECV